MDWLYRYVDDICTAGRELRETLRADRRDARSSSGGCHECGAEADRLSAVAARWRIDSCDIHAGRRASLTATRVGPSPGRHDRLRADRARRGCRGWPGHRRHPALDGVEHSRNGAIARRSDSTGTPITGWIATDQRERSVVSRPGRTGVRRAASLCVRDLRARRHHRRAGDRTVATTDARGGCTGDGGNNPRPRNTRRIIQAPVSHPFTSGRKRRRVKSYTLQTPQGDAGDPPAQSSATGRIQAHA